MPQRSCRWWIEKFKEDYFARGKTEVTWRTTYMKFLKRLPASEPLTKKALHNAVLQTKVNTKTRKDAAMVANMLARFAGVKYDASPYRGNHSARKLTPRDIPTDEEIAVYYRSLDNRPWRWFFGMVATYGLRPHEVFFVDLKRLRDGDSVIHVKEGKTGERFVWPFHPEWWGDFSLFNPLVPPIKLNRSRDRIGHSATRYFWQREAPFRLMDLRHAWAIRVLEYGLENTFAAQQMGHSVDVHEEIYQHWITLKVQQRAYDRVLKRDDRPKPPSRA